MLREVLDPGCAAWALELKLLRGVGFCSNVCPFVIEVSGEWDLALHFEEWSNGLVFILPLNL